MSARSATLLVIGLAGGCGFSPLNAGQDGPQPIDAARDTPDGIDDGPPDAFCAAGFVDLCAQGPADPVLVISGAQTFDTDLDPHCRTLAQAGGPTACLLYVAGFQLTAASTLIVRGSRPLVIGSTTRIEILGDLDLSSARGVRVGAGANESTCTAGGLPADDTGGAGGGAGGSFGGAGGNGGVGDLNGGSGGTAVAGVAGSAINPARVRGGCRGQSGGNDGVNVNAGGAGGSSGGAVLLTAHDEVSIAANGVVRANGAGGSGGQPQAGGGGGGSGGFIAVQAPSIKILGALTANAGGGGEGGTLTNGGPVPGAGGTDGLVNVIAASGGGGQTIDGGDGGNGAAGATTSGTVGGSANAGAGGGGGGAGKIYLLGTTQASGLVTPAATTPP